MTEMLEMFEQMVSDEVLPARAYWHRRLEAGDILRIVDLHGCQALDVLFFDADRRDVRYNAPNTIKLAGSVYVSKGVVLYDDLAQPLMAVTEGTVRVASRRNLTGCSDVARPGVVGR